MRHTVSHTCVSMITMKKHPYKHSDHLALTGCMQQHFAVRHQDSTLKSSVESLSALATADDIPASLRRYYYRYAKQLKAAEDRLRKVVKSARCDGFELSMRIQRELGTPTFTDCDLARLHHINGRLRVLEKSIKTLLVDMEKRLSALSPDGVAWDEWDCVAINLWLGFTSENERPSYDPERLADADLEEPPQICVRIWDHSCLRDKHDEAWGLDDGQDHGDLSNCNGHPLQHFNQCYLFHELYDHANIGIAGMLHLHKIWIEIIPHRSGDFMINAQDTSQDN